MSLADQELLGQLGYKQKLAEVENAIQINAEFLDQIVANPEMFEPHLLTTNDEEPSALECKSAKRKFKPSDFEMDKLRSTLKQFVRDWSKQVRRFMQGLQT